MTVVVTAAHGVDIKIGDGATSETFSEIDGVHNGPSGPGFEPQMIEGRHHGSTSTVRKASYVSVPPITFSIYYDSNDTNHLAIVAAAKAKTRKNFQMVLTDTGVEQYAFSAYIGVVYKGEVEGFNVYDVTLNIDGDITIT